jgi:hypothetical protein
VKASNSTRGPILSVVKIGKYVYMDSKTNIQDIFYLIALTCIFPVSDWMMKVKGKKNI